MAAQFGSSMLLKMGDSASPEVFTALAGLRTKSMTFNNESVDVTNSDSSGKWRELLAGAGIKNMAVSGSGVFTDATVDGTLETDALAGTHRNFQVIVPGFGTFEGLFQVSSLAYAGEHNGEVTYDISLESAGAIAFTAAA